MDSLIGSFTLIGPIIISLLSIQQGYYVAYASLLSGIIATVVISPIVQLVRTIYYRVIPNRTRHDMSTIPLCYANSLNPIRPNPTGPIAVPVPLESTIPSDASHKITLNNVTYYVLDGQLWRTTNSNDRISISIPSPVANINRDDGRLWILTQDGSVYHLLYTSVTPIKIESHSRVIRMSASYNRVILIHENNKITCIGRHTCQVIEDAIKLAEECNVNSRIITYYHMSENGNLYKIDKEVTIDKTELLAADIIQA